LWNFFFLEIERRGAAMKILVDALFDIESHPFV